MLEPPNDEFFMREALRLAKKAAEAGEVPVGAVVVRAGKIIARASNQVELLKDATAHAEMLVLTQAEAAVGDWRLTECDLYVTKEPCAMCAGALVHTRIQRVIFGCTDPSAGAAGSVINLLQMPGFNHRNASSGAGCSAGERATQVRWWPAPVRPRAPQGRAPGSSLRDPAAARPVRPR